MSSDIDHRRPPSPLSSSSLRPYEQPTYWQFFVESFDYIHRNLWQFFCNDHERNDYFHNHFLRDLDRVRQQIIAGDLLLILVCSVLLTIGRHLITKHVFIPLTKSLGLPDSNAEKVPESAWKLLFYSCTWISCSFWLFVVNNGEFFHHPESVWYGYSLNEPIKGFFRTIIVAEISFYIHSLYTTMWVDQRRKDTMTLMFHHLICVLLIGISYCNKSHKSGFVVVFLHDSCDILLEGTKLIRYFKVQHNRSYDWLEMFVNIGFVCFLFTWLTNRLYWFPLKIIYISSVYVEQNQIPVPFITIVVAMLWIVLLMNFYWFTFAIRLLYKVATGQINELEDNREFQDDDATGDPEKDSPPITSADVAATADSEEKRKFSVDSGVDLTLSSNEQNIVARLHDNHCSETICDHRPDPTIEDSAEMMLNNDDDASTVSASSTSTSLSSSSSSSAYNLRQRKKANNMNFQAWN